MFSIWSKANVMSCSMYVSVFLLQERRTWHRFCWREIWQHVCPVLYLLRTYDERFLFLFFFSWLLACLSSSIIIIYGNAIASWRDDFSHFSFIPMFTRYIHHSTLWCRIKTTTIMILIQITLTIAVAVLYWMRKCFIRVLIWKNLLIL